MLPLCQGNISVELGISSALRSGQYEIAKYIYQSELLLHNPSLVDSLIGGSMRCIEWTLSFESMIANDVDYFEQCLVYTLKLNNAFITSQIMKQAQHFLNDRIIDQCRIIVCAISDDEESGSKFKEWVKGFREKFVFNAAGRFHNVKEMMKHANRVGMYLGREAKKTRQFDYFMSRLGWCKSTTINKHVYQCSSVLCLSIYSST